MDGICEREGRFTAPFMCVRIRALAFGYYEEVDMREERNKEQVCTS